MPPLIPRSSRPPPARTPYFRRPTSRAARCDAGAADRCSVTRHPRGPSRRRTCRRPGTGGRFLPCRCTRCALGPSALQPRPPRPPSIVVNTEFPLASDGSARSVATRSARDLSPSYSSESTRAILRPFRCAICDWATQTLHYTTLGARDASQHVSGGAVPAARIASLCRSLSNLGGLTT